eukprot:1202778-Amphidinium_carterae.1
MKTCVSLDRSSAAQPDAKMCFIQGWPIEDGQGNDLCRPLGCITLQLPKQEFLKRRNSSVLLACWTPCSDAGETVSRAGNP